MLPNTDVIADYADNKTWRIIFGLNFVFIGLALLGYLVFIRLDTPKFYLSKGMDEYAVESIKVIYNTEGSQVQANKIMRFIQKSCN